MPFTLQGFIDEHTAQSLRWTKDTIDWYGARLAGTESCLNTAKSIRGELEKICE